MVQPRVRWTDEERSLLIEKSIEYRKNHIGCEIVSAIRDAQKYLPSSRRRNPLLLNKTANRRLFSSILATEEKQPVIEDEGPDIVKVEVPVAPDIERLMRDIPSSMLLANLAERWFQWVDGLSRSWLSVTGRPVPAADVQVPKYPSVHGVPRTDGTRIAIVGLLKDQFAEVVNKTNHLPVKPMYVDRDAAKPKIPISAEYVILTKFVKHLWDTAAKQQLPKNRVFLMTGGTQAVIKTIFDIHSRIVASNGHTLQPVV